MPSLSQEIAQLLSVFAVVFTAPTFQNALTLMYGTLLGSGRRTVTSALKVLRVGGEFCYRCGSYPFHRLDMAVHLSCWRANILWLRRRRIP